eukprot:TRINITY_DN292_c0_g1_i1.p1 TRINITY_DN292_c0_g1~~TRINITY_DN292_c0_g1_i1.p1  ORF type:complete len:533 (-),score=52.84 TRINITY_DN292_c0_g1_i1:198-1565(-)
MADEFGPAFTIRIGMFRFLVVSTPELAKECFTINDKAFANRPTSVATKLMGYDGAMLGFSSYGPYWRQMRKMATIELLSNRRLETLKHVRTKEVHTRINELYGLCVANGRAPIKVEMKRWFEELVFNVMVMMIAGKRCFGAVSAGEEEEARRFRKAAKEFFALSGAFNISDVLPFLNWLDLQGQVKAMKRNAKELDSLLVIWVEEHRRKRINCSGESHNDFIDVMLSTMEDAKITNYDPDTIIKATAMNLILAGTDSTAGTLTWALSLLLNNRHILRKAQDELELHVSKDRQVEESDIKNLVYLQAIAKETMRLYPGAPLLVPHEAGEDCNIGGFHVPAGTRLFVNVWKYQRDPHIWSDPSEFRPERFLTTHKDLDFRGQYFEYMPFGSGRRSCPGISFAVQAIHLVLARVLHGFDVVTPSGMPVDMSEALGVAMPKATPLEVILTPRLDSKLYE